jgi:UDP-GlcNAc:undecaprenyl-phosphate GlcNAc-1-phosphate transferase
MLEMAPLWAFLCALGVALVGTPLAMWLARRVGAVAPPRVDRWHKRPTPLMGGIAILAGHTIALLLFAPLRIEVVGLLVAGAAIFGLGLFDDLRPLRPSVKLAGQVAIASLLIPFGVHAIFVIHPVVAIPATLFWIVAITNAFNLLDNMDGLSAGVAAISAGFLSVVSLVTEQPEVATVAAALAGAALGFLVFNFNPARVFMGDCGALFLGFNLGSLAIFGTWREASNLFLVLIVPLCVLAVPLFDTTLVTLLRKLSGRAISQGGRDHSSHRLVALGLSERNAVLVLYAVCLAFGGLAILGLWLDMFATAVAVGVLAVLILLFGVFLGEAKVYGERAALSAAPSFLRRLIIHKWLIIELAGDIVLISVAYLGAYLIRFEGNVPDPVPQQIHQLLPIVLPIHVIAFTLFGVYQDDWRHGGLRAAWRLLKGVAVGGATSFAAVLALTQFTFYSRAVFVIASLLVLVCVLGSRSALRALREAVRVRRADGRRVVLMGAGGAAGRVLQALRVHPEMGLTAVALVDDDPAQRGRRVHGVPVLGACEDIAQVVHQTRAVEVVFAIPSARGEARSRLLRLASGAGVPVQVAIGAREIVRMGGAGLVRPPAVDDLLTRARFEAAPEDLSEWVRDRRILLFGMASAAAVALARSVSDLCARQVILCHDDPLVLRRELEDLRGGRDDDHVVARLCHLFDEGSVARVLREMRPDVVVLTALVRSEEAASVDPAGALERSFLVAANVARQCTAAGVRDLVVWSAPPLEGTGGVGLRLGELAAAALGPQRVVVLRFPPIAQDPDNPLGRAVLGTRFVADAAPLVSGEHAAAPLVLASEVAALSLHALRTEGATILELHVPLDPTATGVDAPKVERIALPRPTAARVEDVARDVREALAGGRLEDALSAASLLVPVHPAELGQGGGMVALEALRRRSPPA